MQNNVQVVLANDDKGSLKIINQEAEKALHPKPVVITGTITAPKDFASKRADLMALKKDLSYIYFYTYKP